jgi:peptidylprolyl isomerase
MTSLVWVIALSCALAFGACGDDTSGTVESPASGESGSEKARLDKPKVQVPEGPPPKKLVVDDLETGSGPAAKAGDEVTVHYVLVEYRNGKEVEASWDRGEPFSFRLGGGDVIPGWEEGVPGMKVDGRRQLIIPSKLAYDSGALVFVIDLLAIGESGDTRDGPPQPKVEVPDGPPPKELIVEDLEEGSGPGAKAGDEISLLYVGVNYKTGEEFQASWDRDTPFRFELGDEEVLAGWEQGLLGMKAGGRRQLIVPSHLAYDTGALIYVIDLLKIE